MGWSLRSKSGKGKASSGQASSSQGGQGSYSRGGQGSYSQGGQGSSGSGRAGPSNNPNPGPPAPGPPPAPGTPLANVRVLQQDRPVPEDTPVVGPTSRTFRVAVFSLHFALTLLETRRGRESLGRVGKAVWAQTSDAARANSILRGDVDGDPRVMGSFVDRFLAGCRRDPPNFIVSDRLRHDGMTRRVNWPNLLGNSADAYNAKWAATFRLNKKMIEAAVAAAARGDDRAFRNSLYVLGVSVAHELVHMFVGFIYGDSGRDTPPLVNHPPGSPEGVFGEAGRWWEHEYFGYIISHFQEVHRHGDTTQPGVFYAMLENNMAYEVDPRWIDQMITLDFTQTAVMLPTPGNRPFKVGISRRGMDRLRTPAHNKDFKNDLTAYFQAINALAKYNLDNATLAHIMRMATVSGNVLPPSTAA